MADKVGDEFLVNTTTTESSQRDPSATGLKDGGFVAIWENFTKTRDGTMDSCLLSGPKMWFQIAVQKRF